MAIMLVAVTCLMLSNMVKNLSMFKQEEEPKEVPYPEFEAMVEAGEVDTITYSLSKEKMEFTTFDDVSPTLEWKELETYEHDVAHTYITLYPASETFREDMMAKGIYVKLADVGVTFWEVVYSLSGFLIPILYILLLFRIMSKSMNMGGQTDKDLVKTSDVRFSNVIGHDEIIDDVKFIVELLKDPSKGSEIGVKPPKGILLNGEPGTGKTLIAKAIAGEASVPFLYINGSSLIELFVGMGAKRVRDAFKTAKKNSPCIVFIDEIDSIGGRRDSSSSHSEHEQTLNALLQEMDGFTGREGIFIIAATNRADILDSALTRAGRFDRRIEVSKPRDWKVRQELFKNYLNNYKVDETVDVENLSRQTAGFTGADVSAICNEAAIIATMKDKNCIDMDCLWEAIDKIVFNGNRSKKEQFLEDKKKVSYHEAGHAVMSYLCKERIARASVIAVTSGVGGAVFTEEGDMLLKSKSYLENHIMIAYAGRASEEIKFGDVTTGASNDIKQATNMLYNYVAVLGFDSEFGLLDSEVLINARIVNKSNAFDLIQNKSMELYKSAIEKLRENYVLVETLAVALLEKETMSGEDITALLDGCRKGA